MSKVFCIMVVDSVTLETVFPGTTWHETESNEQELNLQEIRKIDSLEMFHYF